MTSDYSQVEIETKKRGFARKKAENGDFAFLTLGHLAAKKLVAFERNCLAQFFAILGCQSSTIYFLKGARAGGMNPGSFGSCLFSLHFEAAL